MIISTLKILEPTNPLTKTPPPPRSSVPTPCLERWEFPMKNMTLHRSTPQYPTCEFYNFMRLLWCSIYFWTEFLRANLLAHCRTRYSKKNENAKGLENWGWKQAEECRHFKLVGFTFAIESGCPNPPDSVANTVLILTNEWQQAFVKFSAVDSWLQDNLQYQYQ